MRLLLDTHTFLWWDSNPAFLSPQALALCQDPANQLVVSVVSLWEIEIKRQLGKLSLGRPLAVLVAEQQRTNQIEVMRVDLAHVLALGSLPSVHKDPFDRMLVAQAMSEALPLLSRDSSLSQYPVTILW